MLKYFVYKCTLQFKVVVFFLFFLHYSNAVNVFNGHENEGLILFIFKAQ